MVSGFNQTLSLWDLTTGALIDSFPGYLNGVDQVAISTDGKVVLAAGGRTISVRAVASRELLYPPISVKDDIAAVIMIETNDPEIKHQLKQHFQAADDVEGAYSPYEGLFIHI